MVVIDTYIAVFTHCCFLQYLHLPVPTQSIMVTATFVGFHHSVAFISQHYCLGTGILRVDRHGKIFRANFSPT